MMEAGEITFWSITIILTGISVFLAYLQVSGRSFWLKQKTHFPIKIQDIEILTGREDAIKKVSSMFKNAKQKDMIFGGCTACANLGDDFTQNLARAMQGGATAQILIPLDRNNKKTAEWLLGIHNVALRNGDVGSLRIIGIKNKEVLLAFPQNGGEAYLSLHIPDSDVAKDMYASFANIWSNSDIITEENLKKLQDD